MWNFAWFWIGVFLQCSTKCSSALDGETRLEAVVCGKAAERSLETCAVPMYNIGAFKASVSRQTFAWDFFATQSKQYFTSVCESFYTFDACIQPYKEGCLQTEPFQSRYETAIEILDFICRDGYFDMMSNFDCFVRTLTRADMVQCQAEMVSAGQRAYSKETSTNDSEQQIIERTEKTVCSLIRNYAHCIQYPIRFECGFEAWGLVREVLRRPTRLLMPNCRLSVRSAVAVPTRINVALGLLSLLTAVILGLA